MKDAVNLISSGWTKMFEVLEIHSLLHVSVPLSLCALAHWGEILYIVFSSPEPKARVSYCHSALSVVRPSVVVLPSVWGKLFHIFDFFSRTAWWILMKLGRDEVLMVPYKCCCFSASSAQGRIQGGAKKGHSGSPSSTNFFFRLEGYSIKLNA